MNIGESFLTAANNGYYRAMPADYRQYIAREDRLRKEDVDHYISVNEGGYYQKRHWYEHVKHNYVHDDGNFFSKETLISYLKMELQSRGILDFNLGSGTQFGSTKERR